MTPEDRNSKEVLIQSVLVACPPSEIAWMEAQFEFLMSNIEEGGGAVVIKADTKSRKVALAAALTILIFELRETVERMIRDNP